MPNGAKGFTVDPLADPAWDYFVLDNLRYRGHDVSIAYRRGEGLSVCVDGKTVATRPTLGKLSVQFEIGRSDSSARGVPGCLPGRNLL